MLFTIWFFIVLAAVAVMIGGLATYYGTKLIGLFSGLVTCLVGLFMFVFLAPWGYVHNYELGYKFDARDGSISLLPHTGYNPRTPFFESIYTIDLRPRQVCITVGGSTNSTAGSSSGANSRVLNCKLVKFNPAGLSTFIQFHGAADYSDDTLNDLLKLYAYDGTGTKYPFLTVLRELKDSGGVVPIGQPVSVPAANNTVLGNTQ